ncbi:hypothetical protein Q8A67_002840 [Cirrhinus molitorella]|uniref:Periplakin/Envoplakin N-terminal domain-containing protein n=1 Tax=Cirrhinus molitorella TaxID=172907 RepID=A0AA88U6B6_9TELE|nr:hypothetical protein Q8A67_002840 [Cirrhinus molitorella]
MGSTIETLLTNSVLCFSTNSAPVDTDIRKINEGRLPLYQRDINKTILDSIELLNSLDEDAAEAFRLQHPQSEMIEEDIKQLRERAMKLHEEHDRIYNCTTTFNWEKKTDEKLYPNMPFFISF